MVSKVLNLTLRGFQFFWTLLVIALVGGMIAGAKDGNPSIVNFDMFAAVFAMLSLFYLLPVTFLENGAFPLVMVALDVLNTLFFLCAGIATAAYLGVHSCKNDDYTKSNSVTNGADNREKRCREAQASTAFLWFGFAAFAASAAISVTESRRAGVNLRTPGIRKGGPAMSQV